VGEQLLPCCGEREPTSAADEELEVALVFQASYQF